MKKILLPLFLSVSFSTFAQKDTIIYTFANNRPAPKEKATHSVELKRVRENQFQIIYQNILKENWHTSPREEIANVMNDSLVIINIKEKSGNAIIYRKYTKENNTYRFKDYYDINCQQIKQQGTSTSFLPLHLEGEIKTYYKNGKLKSIEIYKNNQMVSNQNWLANGDKYIDDIVISVDTVPKFLESEYAMRMFIAKNIVYPEQASHNGIQGKVYIGFVIDEEGKMIGVNVEEKVHPLLNSAALQVVLKTEGKWKPGILNGKKVKVKCVIPIGFSLQ